MPDPNRNPESNPNRTSSLRGLDNTLRYEIACVKD